MVGPTTSYEAELTISDVTEGEDSATAVQDTVDFDAAHDPHFSENSKRGPRAGSYKKLMSKCLYEIVRIDREVGVYMLEMYSKVWLQKLHRPENLVCNTFEEYVTQRVFDAGMKYDIFPL